MCCYSKATSNGRILLILIIIQSFCNKFFFWHISKIKNQEDKRNFKKRFRRRHNFRAQAERKSVRSRLNDTLMVTASKRSSAASDHRAFCVRSKRSVLNGYGLADTLVPRLCIATGVFWFRCLEQEEERTRWSPCDTQTHTIIKPLKEAYARHIADKAEALLKAFLFFSENL